jgi:tRNA-binding protein
MTAEFGDFLTLDLRVGTIMTAERALTRKPAYRMTIDFGEEIGKRVSCGDYVNYAPEEIIGKQVIAVTNLPPKRMGPEISEVLVLGVQNPVGDGTVFLTVDKSVPNGSKIF